MQNLLDFENEKHEKGFAPFRITRESIRQNIGKTICYVDYVEPNRGTYFVRHGVIHSIRYSTLYLDDMNKQVDVRDIKECGIKIDES